VERALDHVGIAHLRKRRINELSGGQRQRVYIARALIAHPEVLIMDEPMAGVDVETQEQLGALLQHLGDVHGMTVIMISHDREEIRRRMRTVICLGTDDEATLRQAFPAQRLIRL
jgi:zinc transport system ATP-binding protein